ncbi:hypothetical protein [Butyrivibrio fibrisolvens]|uniref:hypothetical protein n=1 Tax=Butyrivibrio fibrisolvens TaxID=831 RepID=UPI0020BDDFF0|nr:hypothetical protein [Butyrivibrio fibrisolvens]
MRHFFVDDDGKEVSFDVGYPSKSDSMDSDRYVYNACDFEAEYIDVTFDGEKDIVISLGHAGVIGDTVHCAYADEWEECYYEGEVAVTKWLSEIVDDMTADDVIRYILDHQDEYESI